MRSPVAPTLRRTSKFDLTLTPSSLLCHKAMTSCQTKPGNDGFKMSAEEADRIQVCFGHSLFSRGCPTTTLPPSLDPVGYPCS